MFTVFGVWKDEGGRLSHRTDTAEMVESAEAVARDWASQGAVVVTVSQDVEGIGDMVLLRLVTRRKRAALEMAA